MKKKSAFVNINYSLKIILIVFLSVVRLVITYITLKKIFVINHSRKGLLI